VQGQEVDGVFAGGEPAALRDPLLVRRGREQVDDDLVLAARVRAAGARGVGEGPRRLGEDVPVQRYRPLRGRGAAPGDDRSRENDGNRQQHASSADTIAPGRLRSPPPSESPALLLIPAPAKCESSI